MPSKRDTPLDLRPQLKIFASAMEAVLKDHDSRGTTLDTIDPHFSLERIWQEMRELDRAAWSFVNNAPTSAKDLEHIQREATDVANFAAMLWWAAERTKGLNSKHAELLTG